MKEPTPAALIAVAAAALALAPAVRADSQNLNDIMLAYKSVPNGLLQSLDLGSISISLVDNADFARMVATFTVNNPGAVYAGIFSGLNLHWLQYVRSDACPAQFYGTNAAAPTLDPPSGGWDYMYNDGAAWTSPITSSPNYGYFIDSQPWYYNNTGEAARSTVGVSYAIRDSPGYCPANGLTEFATFLVAEPTQSGADAELVQLGQFLLIGGFEWDVRSAGSSIAALIGDPPSTFADEANTALANGAFSGWTPVVGKAVLVPEPQTWALLLLSGSWLWRRARQTRENRGRLRIGWHPRVGGGSSRFLAGLMVLMVAQRLATAAQAPG